MGDESWEVPRKENDHGEIRVILDGPVPEVSSAAGLCGAAIETAGDHFVIESVSRRVGGCALSRRPAPPDDTDQQTTFWCVDASDGSALRRLRRNGFRAGQFTHESIDEGRRRSRPG